MQTKVKYIFLLLGLVLVVGLIVIVSLQPKAVPKTPDWQVYTNQNLGISFQYPSGSKILENKEITWDGREVSVDNSVTVILGFECPVGEDHPGQTGKAHFIVEVNNASPSASLLFMHQKKTIAGLPAIAGSVPDYAEDSNDGREGWNTLVSHNGKYYLIKNEICVPSITKKIEDSIKFLDASI